MNKKMYGVFTAKGLAIAISPDVGKMPLVFVSKKFAQLCAKERSTNYKRLHFMKPVKVTGTK